MELRYFELPPIGTNAYLLFDRERKLAALFDAPMDSADRIPVFLQEIGCELTGVYLTHGHWDHMLDVAAFNRHGIPVFCHHGDRNLVEDPGQMADYLLPGLGVEPGTIDHELVHGQMLDIIGVQTEVRHVPGHSPGSVMFYFSELEAAITGDPIFQRSVGRTDFPGCSFQTLEQSIRQQIYSLPDDTILYPGHGPSTTVGDERCCNPFVHD